MARGYAACAWATLGDFQLADLGSAWVRKLDLRARTFVPGGWETFLVSSYEVGPSSPLSRRAKSLCFFFFSYIGPEQTSTGILPCSS